MKEYWVYILLCSNGRYYTGVTNNLQRRIGEHSSGVSKKSYTYIYGPVKLVYAQAFCYVSDALAWEKQIKNWSQRKKKLLIEGKLFQ